MQPLAVINHLKILFSSTANLAKACVLKRYLEYISFFSVAENHLAATLSQHTTTLPSLEIDKFSGVYLIAKGTFVDV